MTRNQAELLGFWPLIEWNGMEYNHERHMTCPEDHMTAPEALMGGHDAGIAMVRHEPAAPLSPRNFSSDMVHGTSATEAADQPPTFQPKCDRVEISYFHNDPEAAPSANLEYAGHCYALVFAGADIAEEKLRPVCAQEWQDWFEGKIGCQLRQASRAADRCGSVTRYVMSPLYKKGDTFGRKTPEVPDSVAVLLWNDNNEPEEITVIAGGNVVHVPMKKTVSKNPKAPTYKGRVKFDQAA